MAEFSSCEGEKDVELFHFSLPGGESPDTPNDVFTTSDTTMGNALIDSMGEDFYTKFQIPTSEVISKVMVRVPNVLLG
jgi:hypothetical protein